MEIYRWEGTGFRQLDPSRFEEERDLEDLLEQDPNLLLGNERICIISRQIPIGKSQKIDLLALDRQGNCIIIELKRGKTSRAAIAQILDYAAAVAKFSFADIERFAERWSQGQGREFNSLLALHSAFFGYELGAMRRSAFNRRQRMVLVSEGVDVRVLDIAEYLRRAGIDLTYISYFSYQAPDELLIATKTILGTSAIKESRATYQYTPRQFLTRERFLATLTKNQSLHQVAQTILRLRRVLRRHSPSTDRPNAHDNRWKVVDGVISIKTSEPLPNRCPRRFYAETHRRVSIEPPRCNAQEIWDFVQHHVPSTSRIRHRNL